jgi:Ca2+-binding EF-hand superfamily protein
MLIKAFKFFDISGTGEVDLTTFHKAIAKIGVVVEPDDVEEFFGYYDTNGSGTLDYKEFADMVFGRTQR